MLCRPFILSLLFCAVSSYAFVIDGNVWCLSDLVTNVCVYSKLFEVETEAKNKNFEKVDKILR